MEGCDRYDHVTGILCTGMVFADVSELERPRTDGCSSSDEVILSISLIMLLSSDKPGITVSEPAMAFNRVKVFPKGLLGAFFLHNK